MQRLNGNYASSSYASGNLVLGHVPMPFDWLRSECKCRSNAWNATLDFPRKQPNQSYMLTCSVILSGSIISLSSSVYIYTYTYITHTSRCKTHRSICAITRCYESSEVPVVACIEYMSILWLRLHFLLWRSSKPKALQVLPHHQHPFHMEVDFAQHGAKSRKTRKKKIHRIHIMHTFSRSVYRCLHLFTLSLQLMKNAFAICLPPQGVCRVP